MAGKKLTALTPSDLQAYLNRKRVGDPSKQIKALSARTVQYHRAVLRTALAQALEWGEVSRNVAALVKPPRVERKEVEPFTVEQSTALLTALSSHPLEGVVTLALATGMRQGELLGLAWADVDLEAATIRVHQQVQRIERKLTICPLKTD